MGKKQHSKDRMFVTATEWKYEGGGKKAESKTAFKRLPFDHCALGLTPFETPVASPQGHVFDLLNIVPWIKKHGTNPVTNTPLTVKELIRLKFARNTDGQYNCPLTYKVFSAHTHIVFVKTSGNVYSYEAIDQLHVKPKHWVDLVSGEKFTKADVITIQDPHDIASRDIKSFSYVKLVEDGKIEPPTNAAAATAADGTAAAGGEAAAPTAVNAGSNEGLKRILTAAMDPKAAAAAAAKAKAEREQKKAAEFSGKRLPKAAPTTAAAAAATDDKSKAASGPAAPKVMLAHHSTGRVSASFTSTAMSVQTTQERAVVEDDKIREMRYAAMKGNRKRKGTGTKAFVRLVTSLGPINLQIHADLVPRTAHNFLLLCERNYYKDTIFHRVIPGFMIQSGDPTGTGTGGQSAWGKSFVDEFHPSLRHTERGVVSMANSGPNSNKAQFFITFGECAHLDDKHSVFAHVVGGMETLDAMERVSCGSGSNKTRPSTDLKILEISVYNNPFNEEFVTAEEQKKRAEQAKRDEENAVGVPEEEKVVGKWFSNPALSHGLKAHGSGIGKYIAMSNPNAAAGTDAAAGGDDQPASKKLKSDTPTAAAASVAVHPALRGKTAPGAAAASSSSSSSSSAAAATSGSTPKASTATGAVAVAPVSKPNMSESDLSDLEGITPTSAIIQRKTKVATPYSNFDNW